MSHTQVQWGRGTTAQVAGYVGPQGEIALNTDDGALHVQDGATAGGAWIVGGHAVNPQTGTSYTIAVTDQGKLVTLDNAGAVAVTVPQAGVANNFQNGARVWVLNLGAGTVTLTPTTSTINGAASLALPQNYAALVVSDGTNYWAIAGTAAPGLLPTIASGDVLGNAGASAAAAAATTVTALLDRAFGSSQGDILYRGASSWGALAPGSAGQVLESGGSSANPAWGPAVTVVTGTGAQSVALGEDIIVWNPGTPANTTFTLPAAPYVGERHVFKNLYTGGAYTMTIAGNGGQTIDGAATQTITDPYAALTLVYIGSNSWIIA